MRTRSIYSNPRGMVFALTLLILTLPACVVPTVHFPKPDRPEIPAEITSDHLTLTKNSKYVFSVVEEVVDVYTAELYPHLAKLSEIQCAGCTEMEAPVTTSLRGAYVLYVALLKAENGISNSLPKTEQEKQVVMAGKNLIVEMQDITALTIQSLQDADAYLRSRHEWELSQLSTGNNRSFEKTTQSVWNAKNRVNAAKAQFIAALQK